MTHSGHAPQVDLRERAIAMPAGGMLLVGAILAVVGLGFFVALLTGGDPGRAWRSFHINFLFFTGLSLGGIVFAAIQKKITEKLATIGELNTVRKRLSRIKGGNLARACRAGCG